MPLGPHATVSTAACDDVEINRSAQALNKTVVIFEDQIMVSEVSEESTFWMIWLKDDELASAVTDCIYTGQLKLSGKANGIWRFLADSTSKTLVDGVQDH